MNNSTRSASFTLESVGGSLMATRNFLRSQLWAWPVLAALFLAVFGWWVRGTIENGTRDKMISELKTILDADVAALTIWLKSQESSTLAVAGDHDIQELVKELADSDDPSAASLLQSPTLAKLREELVPFIEAEGYAGFIIVRPDALVVGAQFDDWVGKVLPEEYAALLSPVFEGRTVVTRPQKSAILLKTAEGDLKAGVPTMFAVAPVKDAAGPVIAALCVRIRPEDDFTRILTIAQAGQSGQTYAFNADGLLLSQSRFDEDLKQIGLITDDADSRSILNLEIRDPEVDMTQGKRPAKRRSEQELTRMAAAATAGENGVDVDGYRDYRGAPVVGAWVWLEEYGFGVATEVDVAEAYQTLYVLRAAFGILFLLLIAGAVAIFIFTIINARLQRTARKAALEARQLGQYSLDEQIGAGAMGVVYRAHHDMLQRPTAVKLLNVDKTTGKAIARFEREVRLTSQLNHPNTIAIYDFGRTPEGIFYYAMEYLDGTTLEDLVGRFGSQPEGRVIGILTQVCGSLTEAHGIGLIHRDIKPANIIINRRGGMFDVVKLLDFGLVKAVDAEREAGLTAAGALTGTPLYMSPEGVQEPDTVDARSDIYSLGAVGYFLLTGLPLFDGTSAVDICMHQVSTLPESPSARLGRPVAADLEAILMSCLAKDPLQRPRTARDLVQQLDACRDAAAWTQADAEVWWEEYTPSASAVSSAELTAADTIAKTLDQEG
jgi:eukaryotic-like serine/threonine-protein kinase